MVGKLGVVLSGGGLKAVCSSCATFIVLDELNMKPHAVCGSSGGALGAVMYCSGMSGMEMREHLTKIRLKDYYDPDYLSLLKGAVTGFKGWTGVLKGKALRKWLRGRLPVHTFKECPTRCYTVSVNISRGYKDVIGYGDIIEAAAASSAIPFVFKAAKIEGDYYFDGGSVSNVPAYALSENEPDLSHILISSTQDLYPYDGIDYADLTGKFFTPYYMLKGWLEAVTREERAVHIDTGEISHTLMEVKMKGVGFFEPEKIKEAIDSAVDYIRKFLSESFRLN